MDNEKENINNPKKDAPAPLLIRPQKIKEESPAKTPPKKEEGGSKPSDKETPASSPQPQTITPQKLSPLKKEEVPPPPEKVPDLPHEDSVETKPVDNEVTSEKESSWVTPIRTYAHDVARSVKEKGSSLSSMVIAEQDKKEARGKQKDAVTQSPSARGKQLALIVGAVSLVALGSFFVFFVFTGEEKSEPPETPTASKDIIFVEKAKKIVLERETALELTQKVFQEITTESFPINTVEHIYLVKRQRVYEEGNIEGRLVETRLLFPELASLLRMNLPSGLTRAVDPSFVFGIHAFTKNNPFLLFKVSSYGNAFSGMLAWEETILADLAPLFVISQDNQRIFSGAFFKDNIIKNQDVRILEDVRGEIILMYSFVNRETLLITTHEVTLDEIIKRLKQDSAR